MPNNIVIVQGGQYGSEAKGAIVGYLCEQDKVDIAVRTGATNAGHTVYHKGKPFKMQQLPCGFVNPSTLLVLGAGSLIDPEILYREVAMLESHGYDVRSRLYIDRRAGLHVPAHAARSKSSNRHHAIGATGKGCSEALIDRIRNRGTEQGILFGESPYARDYHICDTEAFLNFKWNEGAKILLEGTQGQLLDLYLGPYPYTTHKQTGPAQWMLEAGLSPSLPAEVVLVVRTFPIRVAGNSGPLPQEISWPTLARELNAGRRLHGLPPLVQEDSISEFETAVRASAKRFPLPLGSDGLDQHKWEEDKRKIYQAALSELNKAALELMSPEGMKDLERLFEMTTVTKKLRRIARLDQAALEVSCRQARPAKVALTFMNYWFPQNWGALPNGNGGIMPAEQQDAVRWVESMCHAPVSFISYGPGSSHILGL